MSDQAKGENEIKQNYITVIPVDYPRSRIYPQSSDYLVDQYNDYLRNRSQDEYLRGDYNINSEPQYDDVGPLYTVSQRFEREKPHTISTSNNSSYGLMSQDVEREWERPMHTAAHVQQVEPGSVQQAKPKDTSASNNQLDKEESHHENASPNSSSICICVYLMSRTVVQMDVCNGTRISAQELIQALILEEELGLPRTSTNVFSIWMCSPLLEVQLKPHHLPMDVRRRWMRLLTRYTIVSEDRKHRDEPVLSFQRNVFFSKKDEEKIKDQKLLELLYEEARNNVLEGRYPCEASHYIMLGGIQARIELGPYNAHLHPLSFFREQQRKFLPRNACSSRWSWLRISGKNSPEVRLLEQYKRIPATTPTRKLVRKYLEFCWSLPFYGAAFFPGQIEQPVRGLTSLMTHQDMPVLVAINSQGVYVIDDIQATLLLGLKYEELSWDFAKPSQEDNPDCLPCIFLQFMVLENGTRVSKILQVFSKQAAMMDALINAFVDEIKQKSTGFAEETDRPLYDTSTDSDVGGERIADTQVPLTTVGRRELSQSCLSNKISKLTLATFDDDD